MKSIRYYGLEEMLQIYAFTRVAIDSEEVKQFYNQLRFLADKEKIINMNKTTSQFCKKNWVMKAFFVPIHVDQA
jgi:hypothetical protein